MNIPGTDDLKLVAKDLGFSLTDKEAAVYREALGMVVSALSDLPDANEYKPHTRRVPRVPGTGPTTKDNPFNAYITRCLVKSSTQGPLSGKRVGLKDHISVAGVPMTLGSRFMEGYIPDIDATVVTRLLDAGADITGKLNMDGFSRTGHGGGTGIGDYGRCLNPFSPDHLSGGSSSGCAVAVACGAVDVAIGGDQGGSIRIPAAWCGIVGLKPTYGLVPHTGVFGIETTLDHIGPMSRTVADTALVLECIAGPDGLDPRQVEVPPPQSYSSEMVKGIASVRIGVLREGFGDPVESDVEEAVRESAARLKLLGAQVEDISIPAHLDLDRILLALQVVGTDLSMSTCGGAFLQGYYDTHFIEVFGRFLVNQADLLPPTIKLCMLYGAMQGHRGLKQYGQAQNARIKYRRAYDDIFREVDCLLMPTVPIKAPKYTPPKNDEEALQRTLLRKLARVVTRNSAQFDLTGHPALTVPCALSGNLPVGMQLVGRHFSESLLLQVAFAYEQSFEWNQGVGPADWDPELIVPD